MKITFSTELAPKISIIILAWKLTAELESCLHSVKSSVNTPPFEILIVSNGAESQVVSFLDHSVSGAQIIELSENVGFGQACNIAASQARGAFLLFLNDDVLVESDCIAQLYQRAVSDPDIGAVSGLVLNTDGTIQEAGAKVLSSSQVIQIGNGISPSNPAAKMHLASREIDYGSGAALLVRKDSFESVGGFDPIYEPAYYEDVDLCMSIRSTEKKVIFEPLARLEHVSGGSTSDIRTFREFAIDNASKSFSEKWSEVLSAATARVEETLHIPHGYVPELGKIRLSERTPIEIHLDIQEKYLKWLENELIKTRVLLEQEHIEKVELGSIAHQINKRLENLENRNFLGIIRWQVGKRLPRKNVTD